MSDAVIGEASIDAENSVCAGARKPRVAMVFPSAGRMARFEAIARGAAPREFFYGWFGAREQGLEIALCDSRKEPENLASRAELEICKLRNNISKFGLARPRVRALAPELAACDVAMSFTDAFSLNLGLYAPALRRRPLLLGGFHGLADMIHEVRPSFQSWARRKIAQGLRGLDHAFFFGEADRMESIRLYGLDAARAHLFRFGVDTDFWTPGDHALPEQGFVASVGSDPKRDYQTLLSCELDAPLKIVTRLPLSATRMKRPIEVLRGSLHNMAITDQVLRDLYRAASVVACPVRDVFQPSGYSVTLQAMACGKPVVLSKIRGLWDRDVFRDGENCLLVPPGDPELLTRAINRLLIDPALAQRIGAAARDTAVRGFDLARMNASLTGLIDQVWRARSTAQAVAA